jgi:hypothetical protein
MRYCIRPSVAQRFINVRWKLNVSGLKSMRNNSNVLRVTMPTACADWTKDNDLGRVFLCCAAERGDLVVPCAIHRDVRLGRNLSAGTGHGRFGSRDPAHGISFIL